MWQYAIHRPGLVTQSRMTTVSPARRSKVSFHTRLVPGADEKTACSVDVKRVVHGVIRVHLAHQRIFTLSPTVNAQETSWFSARSSCRLAVDLITFTGVRRCFKNRLF